MTTKKYGNEQNNIKTHSLDKFSLSPQEKKKTFPFLFGTFKKQRKICNFFFHDEIINFSAIYDDEIFSMNETIAVLIFNLSSVSYGVLAWLVTEYIQEIFIVFFL